MLRNQNHRIEQTYRNRNLDPVANAQADFAAAFFRETPAGQAVAIIHRQRQCVALEPFQTPQIDAETDEQQHCRQQPRSEQGERDVLGQSKTQALRQTQRRTRGVRRERHCAGLFCAGFYKFRVRTVTGAAAVRTALRAALC